MKLLRRTFLHLAAGAAVLPAISRMSWAQAYPARSVTLIVFVPAGGTPDIIARLIGQSLSQRFGQSVVIDNRPGAGGNLALQAVARTPADGYTLLLVATPHVINVTLYEKSTVSVTRDIVPVASINNDSFVLLVNPSFPAKTVPEFIAHAKANPGKINLASNGTGNLTHLSGELFRMMTGIEVVHVPYRGEAPALTDLISGQVQVMFGTVTASLAYIRAGKLRALAVTTATRSEALPDVPSVGDFVPGYEVTTWAGIGAPRGTPPEVIDRLNREINAGLDSPRLKARYADLGATAFAGSPADFGKFMADDTEKWAKVIKFANIRAE
jgi:tripartite-type tricarboxylate transporter receptor subunit TctC